MPSVCRRRISPAGHWEARLSERGARHEESEERWSEWMRRANEGDRAAYRKLLEEIGGAMEAYLLHHFGDVDFVEDCVQECLLSIHRARHTYDTGGRFRPWMFTIVRHKAIDFLRRRGARARVETPGERASEIPRTDPRPSMESDVGLAQLLSELPPKYRRALLLTKFSGYSISDAAAREGVSAAAMKMRVHRAIAMARKRLLTEGTA